MTEAYDYTMDPEHYFRLSTERLKQAQLNLGERYESLLRAGRTPAEIKQNAELLMSESRQFAEQGRRIQQGLLELQSAEGSVREGMAGAFSSVAAPSQPQPQTAQRINPLQSILSALGVR